MENSTNESTKKTNDIPVQLLNEKKRRVKNILLALFGVLILTAGASYAYISFNAEGKETNLIKAGCLKFSMTESAGLNLGNSAPMQDSDGLLTTPYTFTIKNECTSIVKYNTTFNVLTTSNLDNSSKVKVALGGDATVSPKILSNLTKTTLNDKQSNVSETYLLNAGYLGIGETKTFNLRMWIDYDTTSFTGAFDSKIIVEGTAVTSMPTAETTKLLTEALLGENNSNVITTDTTSKGLHSTTKTISESGTAYYYVGNVTNNFLNFANMTWRIMGINEDGSIRLILANSIDANTYEYSPAKAALSMYYEVSTIKDTIEDWYTNTLKGDSYNEIVDGTYCEAWKAYPDSNITQTSTTKNNAKIIPLASVEASSDGTTIIVSYTTTMPALTCKTDSNSISKYTAKVALPRLEEILSSNSNANGGNVNDTYFSSMTSYLFNGQNMWTMSPAQATSISVWGIKSSSEGIGSLTYSSVENSSTYRVRPVINIASTVKVTGSGSIDDMYTVVSD